MSNDPGSLDRLRDIAVPAPVPWWPPAPGWWVVVAVVVAAGAALAIRRWRAWRANAYRRAALRELHTASTATEIAEILKRTALSAFPRTEVASLSGSAWCRWLGKTGGRIVPAEVEEHLTRGVFRETPSGLTEMTAFAEGWIRDHRADQ